MQHLRRRNFLIGGLSCAVAGFGAPDDQLDVAYAGSMSSLMEGSVKVAIANRLHLAMHGRPQGSSALANLIAAGSIRPDVFVPITAEPMQTVLRSGKAKEAFPVAHTEMVIAYSPKSRFAARFQAASQGKENVWNILGEPGLRFGRTDPIADPQGRNIIFTAMLASKLYGQPDLVRHVLGPTINPKQISEEPIVEARLQSGELDAASAYKIQPGPFHLPFINLPREINLGSDQLSVERSDVSLSLNGKLYQPEPLIYYAAALNDAPHPKAAAAFVEWLEGDEGKATFRKFNYDAPLDAPPLHG